MSVNQPNIRPFVRGEVLTAARMEELRTGLTELARTAGYGWLETLLSDLDTGGGTQSASWFLAFTTETPCFSSNPDGSPTTPYTDPRYYVKVERPLETLEDGDLIDTEEEDTPGLQECLTATNMAELADGTHLLPEGSDVLVFTLASLTRPGVNYYFFFRATGSIVLWGKVKTPGWSPGQNTITLQPCKTATDGTTLKKPDGVTPVDPLSGIYILLPVGGLCPCFQPQVGDILGYKTEGGISYLVNPALLPVAQNQFETIVEMSATPATTPHWVNSYPLIHN